jgi:hypothetical protein
MKEEKEENKNKNKNKNKKGKKWESFRNYLQSKEFINFGKDILKIIILIILMLLIKFLIHNIIISIQQLSVGSFIEENERKYLKELKDFLLIEKNRKEIEELKAEESKFAFNYYLKGASGLIGMFYLVKGMIGKHYVYENCSPEADVSTVMANLKFDLIGEDQGIISDGRIELVRRWSHFLKTVPDNYIPEWTVKEVTKIILHEKFGARGYFGIRFPTKEDEMQFIQAIEALMKRKIIGVYNKGISSRLREYVKKRFKVEDAIRSLGVVDWLEIIYDRIDKNFFIEFLLWVMVIFYTLFFFLSVPDIDELNSILEKIPIIESYIEGYKINYNLVKDLSLVIFKGYWGYLSEYDKLVEEVLTRNNVLGKDREIFITIMDRLYIDKFISKK